MDDFRKSEISFSFLFHHLYGDKTYREVKDYHDLPAFKKYLLKLTKSIKLAIEANLHQTDTFHKTKLINITEETERLINGCKSFDDLDQFMIAFEAEIIFWLLGFFPSRFKNTTNRKSNWVLDSHRNIIYTQNYEQMKNLIFYVANTKQFENEVPTIDKLRNVFQIECKNSAEEFVKWFKSNYPISYLSLF